jgi:hypothetical protein
MPDQFSTGFWWFPEDKTNKKWSGTLRHTPNSGAVLQLVGFAGEIKNLFRNVHTERGPGLGYQELILGVTPRGSFTLYDCYCLSWPPEVVGWQDQCL